VPVAVSSKWPFRPRRCRRFGGNAATADQGWQKSAQHEDPQQSKIKRLMPQSLSLPGLPAAVRLGILPTHGWRLAGRSSAGHYTAAAVFFPPLLAWRTSAASAWGRRWPWTTWPNVQCADQRRMPGGSEGSPGAPVAPGGYSGLLSRRWSARDGAGLRFRHCLLLFAVPSHAAFPNRRASRAIAGGVRDFAGSVICHTHRPVQHLSIGQRSRRRRLRPGS
jgi:hypothetical protein